MTTGRYVEIAQGAPNCRRLVGLPDGAPWPPEYADGLTREAFASAYIFDNQANDYTGAHTGSLRGFTGPCMAVGVHFDLDGPAALEDSRRLVDRLLAQHSLGVCCDDVLVWYSGNKGFHLLVVSAELLARGFRHDTPEVVRNLAATLANDLPTFDRAVYDRLRLMRVAGSRHAKTGLFKAALDLDSLLSLDLARIREIALRPQTVRRSALRRIEEVLYVAA